MNRPSMVSPKIVFDGVCVHETIPLEDKDENKVVVSWLYKEEVLANLTVQSREITLEKYGQGLKLIK